MTLEDFFTLTEMKDGLTALARVEELVAVIKKKDGVVKNVGDMTRQWAAVASTIAATENKECLDLFIQLDGLCFIDKWLREAETLSNEGTACFVEEAISALLQAVEKLQIDHERLVSSGICITVKGLLSYKSLEVRDKARTLFDSWKFKNIDIESMDVDYVAASDDAKKISEHAESQGIVNDAPHAKIPCDQMSNGTEGEKIKSTVDHDSSHMDLGPGIMKEELPDSVAKLDSILNDPSVKEEVLCSSGGYSVSQVLAAPNQGTGDVIPVQFEHICEEKRHGNELEDRRDSVDKVTASSSCVASEGIDLLSKTDVTIIESAIHSDMGTYEFNASERVLSKTSSFDDTNQPIGESTNELRLEEDKDKDDSRTLEQKCLEQGVGFVVVDTKDQGTTVFRMDEDGKDNEGKKQRKSKKKFGRSSRFARLTKTSKNADLIQQTANMELEDGTFDALEVARLVAKEVEREVGDYDEKSGSSSSYTSSISDRSTADSISQPSSPESINGERNLPLEDGPTNEQTMENMTPEAPGKELCNGSATTVTNLENNLQDMESSQLTDAVKEAGSNTEKCLLEFDLNQEFLSEELDQNQVDGISNPVSVVSASRAVVAPGNSAGPLKFEGSLGWKGSAATSAFRPAPPRRTSDSDTGGATSSSSRQRQVFLDIDLNVAQGGDVKVVDHMSGKGKQIIGGLPSGESSVEMNYKIPERLKFDLNQTEEDGSQWKMGGLLLGPTKWGRSPSPASSSSCIQPASRSFDLNDNPCIANDPSAMQPFPWNLSSNSKVNHQEDSVISLLGTKIKKGTFPPQAESTFLNGRPSEPLIDTNMLRGMGFGPPVPYPQSVYGYNGFAMGPAAPAPIYGPGGPVPYMFDTRGTPTPFYGAVPSPYSHPYMMGSAPAPNVDLNSGNRDPAFFRQLFIPGQGRPLEISRPLSSGSSGPKRKEPDSGWELYPANFKPPHQPPHF